LFLAEETPGQGAEDEETKRTEEHVCQDHKKNR